MANLRETSTWEAGIYQWETSDPVMGGADGVDNRPTRQLANRTLWLKTELAKAVASIGQNKTAADQGLAGKVDKTTQVTAGAGLTGGGALGGNIQIQMGTPGKLNGTTTNWAGSNTHTHEIDKATATLAGVVKLIDNLTAGGTDAALTAEQGKNLKQLIDAASAGAVPYTGATKHVDLNGKNLTNMGEVKLGDGRNSNYQQIVMGNYERAAGQGNYGAIFNGKFAGGTLRWATLANFGENGNHISSLFADAAKAYVRLGDTNHELTKAADTILLSPATSLNAALGHNRIVAINGGSEGLPAGAYPYGIGLSLDAGNPKAQLYIAHTGGIYARGAYRSSATYDWYRVDGADWADVRGKPTNLAGYGITDAARKVDMRSHIPSTSTPWQTALPNQIPEGIYEGLTTNANLQGGGVGVMRIVKAWGDGSGDYAIYREGTQSNGETYRQYSNSNMTAWRERIRIDSRALAGQIEQAAPSGTVMYFAGRNPPAGWLKANGAAVSRTTYAPLFAAIGTTYGSGDGSTTFNLPDLRGEFVRGWDDGRGIDAGRGFSTRQDDQVTEHYHGIGYGDEGNDGYFLKNTWERDGHEHYYAVAGEGTFIVHDTTRQPAHNNHEFATSGVNGQTGETRPRNVALLACIKI